MRKERHVPRGLKRQILEDIYLFPLNKVVSQLYEGSPPLSVRDIANIFTADIFTADISMYLEENSLPNVPEEIVFAAPEVETLLQKSHGKGRTASESMKVYFLNRSGIVAEEHKMRHLEATGVYEKQSFVKAAAEAEVLGLLREKNSIQATILERRFLIADLVNQPTFQELTEDSSIRTLYEQVGRLCTSVIIKYDQRMGLKFLKSKLGDIPK